MVSRKPLSQLLGFSRDRLKVIKYLGKLKYDKHWWLCSCNCGGQIKLTSAQVKSGPESCGCRRKETMLENRHDPTKHGLHKHRLYTIWHGIKQRCTNPKTSRYEYYGGKGITVCEEWSNFLVFYNWSLENGYDDDLTIDRKNSELGYNPENCQWVTLQENTRRSNVNLFRRNDGTFRERTRDSLQEN